MRLVKQALLAFQNAFFLVITHNTLSYTLTLPLNDKILFFVFKNIKEIY